MSQAVNLVGKSVVHGSGLTEGKYLPSVGVSGRALTVNPCCSRISYGPHSQVVWPLRCASVGPTYVCRASSNNNNNNNNGAYNRRNPDYPRQNKQAFSRGRNNNRNQSDERERDRDGIESLEDSDILSSKNGPYVSLSNSPKFHVTATPGPREKEIVELFRKVQAQLRERAAFRDEKRNESAQGQGKDNETVDSLLKLLRKHSTEQAKRSSGRDYSSDHQQGHNGQYIRGKSTGSAHSSNSTSVIYSGQDSISSSSSSSPRPASSFQRRSPIPRTNFQAFDEGTGNSAPRLGSGGKGKMKEMIPEAGLGLEFDEDDDEGSESESEADEPELVQLLEPVLSSAEEAVIDNESDDSDEDEDEEEEEEHEDLSAWKLAELRALAKSRGMKGYSKMKKSDLVDLLSGASA